MTDITVNSTPSVVEVNTSPSTTVVNTTPQNVTVSPTQQNVVVDGTGPSTTITTQPQEINVDSTAQNINVSGQRGPDGAQGVQGNYTVRLFSRDTNLSAGDAGPTDVIWMPDNGRGTISGVNANSWSTTVPTGSGQLYETENTFNPEFETQIDMWSIVFQAGAEGPPGPAGIQGERGLQGLMGLPGMDGTNGMDGQPGMDGTPGMDGQPGMDGMDGTNGMDGIVPMWDVAATYTTNDLVVFEGRIYRAVEDITAGLGNPSTETDSWCLITSDILFRGQTTSTTTQHFGTILVDDLNNNEVYFQSSITPTVFDSTNLDSAWKRIDNAPGGGTDVVANPTGTDGADLTRIAIDGTNYNIAGGLTDIVVKPWNENSAYADRELVDFNNKLFLAINAVPASVSSVSRPFNLGAATYTAATDTYRFQLSGDFDPVAGTTYFMFLRWNAQNGVPANNYTFSIDGADVTKTVDANNLAIWTFISSDVTAVPNPGQANIDIQAQGVNLVFVVSRLANNYADSYVSDEGIVFVNQSPLSDFGGRQWSGELGGVIYNVGRQYEIGDVVFFNEELYYAATRPAPGALPDAGGAWVNYGAQTGGNAVTDGPEGTDPLSIGVGRYAFNNNLRVTPSPSTIVTPQGPQADGVEINATTSLIHDEDGATLITPADRIRLDNTISVALTTDANGDVEAALTSNTVLREATDLDLGTITTVFPPRPYTNGAGEDVTGTFSGALGLSGFARSGNTLSVIQNGATADRDDLSGELANEPIGALIIEYEDAAATMPTGNQFIGRLRTTTLDFIGFGLVRVGLIVFDEEVHAGTATGIAYDNTRFYTVGTQGSSTTVDREEFAANQIGQSLTVEGPRQFVVSQADAAAPEYLTGTTYRLGSFVTSDNRVWRAIQAISPAGFTLPENDPTNWAEVAGGVSTDNHVQAGVVDGDDLNLFYGTDTTVTPDVTIDVSSLAGGGSVRPNIGQLRTAIFDEYINRVPDTRNAEGSLLTRNWTVRGTNVLEEFIRETNGTLIEKVYTGPLVTSFAPDAINIELLRVFTRNAEGNVISDMWEFGVSSGLMTSASYRFYPGFERNGINFRNVPVGSVTQTGRVVDFDDTVFTVVGRDVQLV